MAATKKKTSKTATEAPVSESVDSHVELPDAAITETGASVAPIPPDPSELVPAYPEDVFRAMSAADESQLVQELTGNASSALLYGFQQGGKQVIGLSAAGVSEAARQMCARGLGKPHVTADPAPIFETIEIEVAKGAKKEGVDQTEVQSGTSCLVYAEDSLSGAGAWGHAQQPDRMRVKVRGKYEFKQDPFAKTKALSKASRNALERLLPLSLVEALKAQYRGSSIQYLPGANPTEEERPPALTDVKASDLTNAIRAEFEGLKKDREDWATVMSPARFNSYLASCAHSHERLADFLDHVKELRSEK